MIYVEVLMSWRIILHHKSCQGTLGLIKLDDKIKAGYNLKLWLVQDKLYLFLIFIIFRIM